MNFIDEQKRKINNKIMTDANPRMSTNSTLCWLCKHCTGGHGCPCSKTTEGKPVAGWKAEDSKIHPGEAWCVKECPLFDFNYSLRWELPTVMPLLINWCHTKTGKPLYYNAIIRDPVKWIDEYNSQMPRELQIDPILDNEQEDGEDVGDDDYIVPETPMQQAKEAVDKFDELFYDELHNDRNIIDTSLFEEDED